MINNTLVNKLVTDNGILYTTPQLEELPANTEKRLIDVGMLYYEASIAGFNERYRRGETSHTIHVWWARRPHSAMRALVFASVCKDTSSETVSLMSNLTMRNDIDVISKAKKIILSGYSETPKLLDMFGGGGTIPFESKKLGLDTYSIDANEMSVFIQKCNMVYADGINIAKIIDIVRQSGTNILNKLKRDTQWLFPLREKYNESIFGYLWTYKKACENCGYKFYLIKRPWLTKKKGKNVTFIVLNKEHQQEITFGEVTPDYKFPFAWEKRNGHVRCPKCGKIQENVNIKLCEDSMIALISKTQSGKKFYPVEENAIPSDIEIQKKEEELLKELDFALPSTKLPRWSGIVNPALYGIDTHADFLNRRQRMVLLYLIRALKEEYYSLKDKHYDTNTIKFVIGVLSSLMDQIIDWNCRLSMWIPQNEQVGRAFCGPGVAMLWDYAETDQLLNGPANLWDKLDRIIKGIKSFEGSDGKISVQKAYAQKLPFKDNFFDAIVTDPPYYDNIYYSILADFFYTWKKAILEIIEPELFKSNTTDYKYELVASSIRNGTPLSAHEKYCEELKQVFIEAARVLKEDGVFSFIYSHSSINGWDAIIKAFRNSPFIITSVQPLSIERKGRPRAFLSEAVNTCMTFVARKSFYPKKDVNFEDIVNKTKEIIHNFGLQLITKSGWKEPDAAIAVLANSVGMIANANKVKGVDSDIEALKIISKLIKDYFPSFSIKTRESL